MLLALTRWLGPFTSDEVAPPGVHRREVMIDSPRGRFAAWVYRNDAPRGALLLVPGLHFLGPADPRLDRFARVLANAGIFVLVPFLPDFRVMRVASSLKGDVERCWDALLRQPDLPPVLPGVMSISYGSFAAIALSAKRDVGGLLLFGGYADFQETVRFSISGDGDTPHDPLNQPVVYLNLLDHLDLAAEVDRSTLNDAWLQFIHRTWGRPEMKERALFEPVAHAIAATLHENAREPFLRGVGLRPGGLEWALEALERSGDAFDHLDPLPYCAQVQVAPITIVHGRDDDVIPYSHAQRLADALPSWATPYITGLYAHTGGSSLITLAEKIPALKEEFRTMVSIVRAFVTTSRKKRTP